MHFIKRLQVSHVDLVFEIGARQENFYCIEEIDFWSKSELKYWLSEPNDVCLGLFMDTKLIGYCLSHGNLNINKISIENVYIDSSYRKKGYGKLILQSLLEHYQMLFPKEFPNLRFIGLIKQENHESISLVKRCGFTIGETMVWVQK